ncbi:MAG: glycosyltransferase family 39 protein [Cyanobacteria bacterium TGS_CYA1]|nr:glycosyltransferase family 39 protein [Cyanobacteria bacterium TGS_CYA1]
MTVSVEENLRVTEVEARATALPRESNVWKEWVPVLLVVGLGLCLRLHKIGEHGFFIDEVYTALVVNGKADPELVAFDSIRPLYFELMKFWNLFGQNEVWMRLFSTVFGALNIALVYQLGKKLANKKVGLIAAVILALSPMEIHYSQQARMYTLGSFFALLGSIHLTDVLSTGRKFSLVAWAAARTLMIWTLPLTAVLIVFDLLIAAFNKERKKFLVHMSGWLVAVALMWAPVLNRMWQLNQNSPYDEWRGNLPLPLSSDFMTMIINFTCSAIPLQEWKGPPVQDIFSLTCCLVLAVLLGLGVIASKNKSAVLWGVAPLFALFAVSFFAKPLLITRYCMFTAPFIFIVVATGVAQLWKTSKVSAVILPVLFALAIGTNLNYFYNHQVHEDWRAASKYLMTVEKPGDEILVWNYHSQYSFPYYYSGQNHVSDIRMVVRDRFDLSKGSFVQFENIKPKPGQRLLLVCRIPSKGFEGVFDYYQNFLENIDKQFKVLHRERIGMMDVIEVELI